MNWGWADAYSPRINRPWRYGQRLRINSHHDIHFAICTLHLSILISRVSAQPSCPSLDAILTGHDSLRSVAMLRPPACACPLASCHRGPSRVDVHDRPLAFLSLPGNATSASAFSCEHIEDNSIENEHSQRHSSVNTRTRFRREETALAYQHHRRGGLESDASSDENRKPSLTLAQPLESQAMKTENPA